MRFFPSFCFWSSFIFRDTSPPYYISPVSIDLHIDEWILLTHLAVTFFLKAGILEWQSISSSSNNVRVSTHVSLATILCPKAVWITTSKSCFWITFLRRFTQSRPTTSTWERCKMIDRASTGLWFNSTVICNVNAVRIQCHLLVQ